ncbi:hypothetical protein K439DRAFT_406690 [Ramaria rubella]|nr:hypothetical protein K439DRAFT_406690 [Ramaria rubella]
MNWYRLSQEETAVMFGEATGAWASALNVAAVQGLLAGLNNLTPTERTVMESGFAASNAISLGINGFVYPYERYKKILRSYPDLVLDPSAAFGLDVFSDSRGEAFLDRYPSSVIQTWAPDRRPVPGTWFADVVRNSFAHGQTRIINLAGRPAVNMFNTADGKNPNFDVSMIPQDFQNLMAIALRNFVSQLAWGGMYQPLTRYLELAGAPPIVPPIPPPPPNIIENTDPVYVRTLIIYTDTIQPLTRDVVIILTFTPLDQGGLFNDQFPVAWKVLPFAANQTSTLTAVWKSNYGFIASKVEDGRTIFPKTSMIVGPGQVSHLTSAPNGALQWSAPGPYGGTNFTAINDTTSPQTIVVGIQGKTPVDLDPVLYFNSNVAGGGTSLVAQPTPMLQAYFQSEFQENDIVRGSIQGSGLFQQPINVLGLNSSTTWRLSSDPATQRPVLTMAKNN